MKSTNVVERPTSRPGWTARDEVIDPADLRSSGTHRVGDVDTSDESARDRVPTTPPPRRLQREIPTVRMLRVRPPAPSPANDAVTVFPPSGPGPWSANEAVTVFPAPLDAAPDGSASVIDVQAGVAPPARAGAPSSRPFEGVLALGSLAARPYVTLSPTELRRRPLDPHSAFILGLLDGQTSIEAVLDVCPLATFEALRILGGLLADGIIALNASTARKR